MPEQFDGKVDIGSLGDTSKVRITLDGDTADIITGGNGRDGGIFLKDSTGKERIRIYTFEKRIFKNLKKFEPPPLELDMTAIELWDKSGEKQVDLTPYGLTLYQTIRLGGTGEIVLDNDNNQSTIYLNGRASSILLNNTKNQKTISLYGEYGTIDAGGQGTWGLLRLSSPDNIVGANLHGNGSMYLGGSGLNGSIIIRNNTGSDTIHLDGATGDIRLIGADCAEEFDITGAESVEPGMVMVLDRDGALRPSEQAYDKRVAGVISGAGDLRPGVTLDRQNDKTNRLPLALTGKVYCKTDAQYGPVEVGDLLTTSPTYGHAMKADDPIRSFGAVIGKALRPMETGRGIIPILTALQ